MSRTLLLGAVLLAAGAACAGAPEGRQACDGTAACPAGEYCARTAPRTCWPDLAAPSASQVTVTCSTSPCRRDAHLTVEAQAHDDEALAAVTVALDLDGGARRVPMARVGDRLHRATLALVEWPFPGADLAVTATVRAEDEVGKAAVAVAAADQRPAVTRRGPVVELGVVPTPPAVTAGGTVVVGGSDGRLRFIQPDGTMTVSAGVFGLGHVHPPVIGQSAIWVVAGNRLFAVSPDGAGVLNGDGYDAGGAIPAPPAITAALPTAQRPEVAFVGSAGGRMAAVKADVVGNGLIDLTRILDPSTAGPILLDDTSICGVTSGADPAQATLRRFSYDGALGEGETTTVGGYLNTPIAAGFAGAVWTASADVTFAKLQLNHADGTPGPSAALGSNPGGGPVVLADGSAAVSVGATLRRHLPSGLSAWVVPAPLGGAGLTPLVLAGPGTPTTLLVPTRAGGVDAVRAEDGARLWSASLTVNGELREGTAWPAADGLTSLAWFTSGDGLLHGLVVDGALDPAAPWPKAWHDPRNTGNLATPR